MRSSTPIRPKRKFAAYRWGIFAEYCCAAYLFLKGYALRHIRYRSPYGEIDLIVTRGDLLVFVEVKARKDAEQALHAIDRRKQQRIIRAAEAFLAAHPRYASCGLRFDVMVITSPFHILHQPSAWSVS